MIREMTHWIESDSVDGLYRELYRFTWTTSSIESHASPRWHDTSLTDLPIAGPQLPEHDPADPDRAAGRVQRAAFFLSQIRLSVMVFYGREDGRRIFIDD
ncbi:MAG: hypothetical protein H0V09_00680 [Gemmatimonadetes bacterium]|nr:hypothetical protein [Gemmatimonadota bacterium]